MSKPYFDPIDPKPDFPKMERDLLDHWYSDGIVDKYLNKNKNSKKYFSFQDGPITANNPMGVHHAWGRTYKDLWPRFKSMQGFRQRHQNGFDCQGLWVEVEVEKEQGFKSKKDIESFGVAKFVELCKERVKKYSAIQTEQSKRLGYFADWDHSYYTLSDDNNYMIWHFLKVVHENGWLYKGNDSVPWCPRCETAISQHEMLTEDYKEATHESIYMRFPIIDTDENLLVWTTTPWTIPANIAVAVDKKIDYVLVEVNGIKYWLADEAKENTFKGVTFKVLKKVKGSELVGLKYSGVFDDLPAVAAVAKDNPEKFHIVVATNNLIMPITTTEGTGMVHTAVSAGTEDFKLGKELGLPMIPVINDDASYMAGFNELTGQNAKWHPRIILDIMEEKGFAFKIEKYTHRYPACWRCKTELVWKVTDEWYIRMDTPSNSKLQITSAKLTLRQRMKEVTKKINWIPEFGLKRELDWLENMHDWLISKKNRYWGLALPIWECKKCGNFDVIGGKDELKEKTVSGWDKFDGKSPHKPQIDEIKIKCSKCAEAMNRIEPVGNPWLDAGIVQFSTISENNEASNFDVTDTKPLYLTNKKEWEKWFPVDFITESFPGQFKNWFYSMIAMSSVLENKNPFKTVLGFATQLGEDGRAMHKSWGNAIEFNEAADKIGSDVMRWMFVRQDPKENMLFGYKLADETRRQFHLKLWNVYNFFVSYANADSWSPDSSRFTVHSSQILDKWILIRLNETIKSVTDNLDKFDPYNSSAAIDKFVDDLSLWYIRRSRDRKNDEFYLTTYNVLVTLSKLLAPFIPFFAEIMYTNLTKEESVHLSSWPIVEALSDEDKKILVEMQDVRLIVEIGHSLRKEANIPVRQPLKEFSIINLQFSIKELEQILLDELNVKAIKYGQEKNKLDLEITPELKEEADTRDLIRKIQNARKEIGTKLDDRVKVIASWIPTDKKMLLLLKTKTLCDVLELGEFNVTKI